jgi:formylglycine-generating enzyme required for sulfatase activity
MKKNIIFLLLLLNWIACTDEPNNEQVPILENFTASDGSLAAQITEDGSGGVQQHGFVYSSINTMPTLEDTLIDLGSLSLMNQPHIFRTQLAGLKIGVTYYIRAFVRNQLYTVYSDNVETWHVTLSDPFPPIMVTIPSGTFQMGKNGVLNEEPLHTVTLNAFKVSKYEITQKQWRDVMGQNPSTFSNCDNCPVETVSYDDVQLFLQTLNAATGKAYRLLTEAEWEYVARSEQNYLYSGSDNIDIVAWYQTNSDDIPHLVGQKLPNGYGVYDMTGNVWEWCQDVWHNDYNGAPSDGSAWIVGGDQTSRILRGGGWAANPSVSRLTFRNRLGFDIQRNYVGFRIAL